MQPRTDDTVSTPDSFRIRDSGRTPLGAFLRHWGPCVLTALVVPGGIVIALLLVWRRWSQRRQAIQSPAGA